MVLGFGKPSRKYATTQTSNYHPDTGYPVGQDESRIRREREERQRRYREEEQQAHSGGGYGYGQDSSSDDDGGAYQRRGEHVNGVNGRSGNRVKTIDHAFPPSSSSRQQHAPASNLHSTPFPTFRPKSSSSASALAVQSQVGKTGGKPKKVKKKTDIEKQFQAFSVLDLAPPAPGSTATAIAGGVSNGAERKKTKKKKLVTAAPVAVQPEPVGSEQVHERDVAMNMNERSQLGAADDRAREQRSLGSDLDLGSEVDMGTSNSRSVSQVSTDTYARGGPLEQAGILQGQAQRPVERTSPLDFEDRSGFARGSGSPSGSGYNSRSRSPSGYHLGSNIPHHQTHAGQYSNESTPPLSELGRPQSSVQRSYDAASPWTHGVEERPVSRMTHHRGVGSGSPGRSRPTTPMMSTGTARTRTTAMNSTLERPRGGSRDESESESDDDRSDVLELKSKADKVRPIPGVSRSYKMVPRTGSGYGRREYVHGEEREYGDDYNQDHEDEHLRDAQAEDDHATPEREKTEGNLMPPMLSIQPPTPLKEEQEESPLEVYGSRLEGVQEEETKDEDHAVEDEEAEDHFPARPTFRNNTSNGSSRTSSGSPHASVGTPPPPADPNQPAYLKWDQQSQRWIPIVGAATVQDPPIRRAESVVSSTSAYSQASAPVSTVPIYPQGRRSSLPAIQTSPSRLIRKGQTPGPSPLSRPSSPGHSRSPSLAGDSPIMLGPMISGESSWGSRRMSIEPAYQLSPNTLTLLPEVQEPETSDSRRGQSEYARSRPPSRATSIRSERMTPRSEGLHRPSSSFSLAQSFRPNMGFPAGYDLNQRISTFGPSASDAGDYDDDNDSRYGRGMHKPKARSIGGSSHYAGSVFEGSQYGGATQTWRRPEQLGRDAGLDTISARGDPVPLLGADGTGEDGRGGYNAMVLPMGAYKPSSDPTKTSSKLDGRVLGMPSSTMSSITLSGTAQGNVGRRLSLTGLSRPTSTTPAHLLADMPPPVTYSAHQAPPSKIGSSQVLVQVYAVALDRFDFDMVREKTEHGSGAGKWVPGRSFVGRALEVGAEVRPITKGDMVMGLIDIKKSGTLAEFIVVDRRRLARTPVGSYLSLEQQACLPLLGVFAHRACMGITRGQRALIMNAHEGVGALVCQELSQLGAHVVAQVPVDVESSEDDAWDNGAREVVADDPVVMLNGQHESGFEFVLDTSGGRRIYDAARRVLRTNGVYVTLFGDDADHLASGPQVKSSLHALRRAFIKKDKKAISYVHLAPGGAEIDVSGQDTRDILEEPVMGRYQPKVGMVIPFERASDAFSELAATVAGRSKEESGSIVVRLMN